MAHPNIVQVLIMVLRPPHPITVHSTSQRYLSACGKVHAISHISDIYYMFTTSLNVSAALHRFSPSCYLDTDGQPTCDQCPTGYEGRNCELWVVVHPLCFHVNLVSHYDEFGAQWKSCPGALSPQEMEGCHACLCVLNDMNLLLHSLQVQMNQLLKSTISITTSKIIIMHSLTL